MRVPECLRCARRAFPLPLACSGCGDDDFTWVTVEEVAVVQTTMVPGADSCVATVMVSGGPTMIAQVPAGTRPGQCVPVLDRSGGAGAFIPPDPREPPS